jgi:hypothetical protein
MHEAARLRNYTHDPAMRAYPVRGIADDREYRRPVYSTAQFIHERGCTSLTVHFLARTGDAPSARALLRKTAKWARRLHAICVSLLPAHTVKEKITMEDLSWLRLLQKPRVDKIPPEAIERKLRALQLVERDGKQLAVTRKGQIAIRLFG